MEAWDGYGGGRLRRRQGGQRRGVGHDDNKNDGCMDESEFET